VSGALSLLRSFLPPDLTPAYLAALAGPLAETLGMAFAAMTIAFLVSLPLGIACGLRVRGAPVLVAGLSWLRAIPDLTLAILCVILFGLGPGAGLVALTLYYTAAVSKVFGDILRTAPRAPVEALATSGASGVQIALFGLLPLTGRDLLSYGAYTFECAVRASVVVGAVGGGGIGTELIGSLAALDFPRASTQILLLVLLIALLDRLSLFFRHHPRWLLALLPVGLAAAWHYAPEFIALQHAARVLRDMVPPALSAEAWAALPLRIGETLWMAAIGTLGAAILGIVAAVAGSRRLAPPWLSFPTRRLLELIRTIPEVVWGLVLVAVIGIGPVAGAWALGLHSLGSLGRLFGDALDDAPERPRIALAGTGASALAVAAYATVPLALGPIAAQLLFRLEWNLRMATVLGLIGAGGIGQALYEAQQLFFYREMLAYLLVTALLVWFADWVSERLRRRLGLARVFSCATA
jgi:phosphonate transport system permease protein